MAASKKDKSKFAPRPVTPGAVPTLRVHSTTNTGGLKPAQQAVVDDNEYTRRMLSSGLWLLLVTPEELDPVPAEPDPADELTLTPEPTEEG